MHYHTIGMFDKASGTLLLNRNAAAAARDGSEAAKAVYKEAERIIEKHGASDVEVYAPGGRFLKKLAGKQEK